MKDLLEKVRELPETSNSEHMPEPKGPGQPILLQKVGRAGAWSGAGWCPCNWSLPDSEPQAEVLIDWVLSCVLCPLLPSPSREGPSLRTSILEGEPSSSPSWFLQNTKKIWMFCSFMTKVHSKYDSYSPISTATVHQLLRTSVFFRHWARGFSCRISSPYHNPLKNLARFTFSQVVQWERLPANAGDAREAGSIPRFRKIPGNRKWQPTQYSCLENSTGQRSLAGYSPWAHKGLDMTEHACTLYNWKNRALKRLSNFLMARQVMRDEPRMVWPQNLWPVHSNTLLPLCIIFTRKFSLYPKLVMQIELVL